MTNKKLDLDLKRRIRNCGKEDRAAILGGLPYGVGFAKPPQHTRFKPGNTHGRRGRPKGSENLHTIVQEEFAATVMVNDAGKPRRLSKQRIAMRQLADKAASGDVKACAQYIDVLRKTGQLEPQESAAAPVLERRDLEAFARIAAFLEGDDAELPSEGQS